MTPAARLQTAAEIVDRILAGDAAEKALTNWARNSRFAGSKDRAAIRDHVFDILRMWRSTAALGGGESGRARVLGLCRAQGINASEVFSGQGHGPALLTEEEAAGGAAPKGYDRWDLPDWLCEMFEADLGETAEATALALRSRAPVFLRVNALKTNVAAAQARLAEEGVATQPHPLAAMALEVTEGARALTRTGAFEEGWVELQDAASQAVVDALPQDTPEKILDFCAGGGGKTLALAARYPEARLFAHDADPRRMKDLPQRARRAGARVTLLDMPRDRFDLVLADAPCSGSGSWRRAPEGKWRLTQERLSELVRIQAQILDDCAVRVANGGVLAYATCSVLARENSRQIEAFLHRHHGWRKEGERQFLPADGGDGFFVAFLRAA